DADAGEEGHLLAAQAGDAAVAAERREAGALGRDLRATGGEEFADLDLGVHVPSTVRRSGAVREVLAIPLKPVPSSRPRRLLPYGHDRSTGSHQRLPRPPHHLAAREARRAPGLPRPRRRHRCRCRPASRPGGVADRPDPGLGRGPSVVVIDRRMPVMTAFPSRTLGDGLTVSAMGLGCMGMSMTYGPPPATRE